MGDLGRQDNQTEHKKGMFSKYENFINKFGMVLGFILVCIQN